MGGLMALIGAPFVVFETRRIFGLSWIWSVAITFAIGLAAIALGMLFGKRIADRKFGPVLAEMNGMQERLRLARGAHGRMIPAQKLD